MTPRLSAFRNDRQTFPVRDDGPADGPVVILLHGFPQDHRSWDRLAPYLHEAGYRTLAPDLRGYSPTGSPASAAEYRMPLLATDVLALADAAQAERFHVVGHDWGGALAWHLADNWPSRVLTITSLSVPHPSAMAAGIRQGDQARKSWYMLLFQVPWVPERFMPRATRKLHGVHPAPGTWRGPLNWYRANSLFGRRQPENRCGVNATYIWGRDDPYLSAYSARRCGDFVNADFESVELEAGHWLPDENPEQCAPAIIRRLGTGV